MLTVKVFTRLLLLLMMMMVTHFSSQHMDVDNWREENKWPNSEIIPDGSVRMIRKPGPRHSLGLMGKKEFAAKLQKAHNRRKFQTFVGLMGKRSFSQDEGAQRRHEDD
ncbi:hypothetical protein JOB18_013217 [Solea senegalensis]|uniref:Uncharacterized protein n=1 Tax=Solea senegalensis TaxID=28829 RepID=A0AAV6PP66_SOLSE|nr:protachykinin isoform X1 [Solea senegalensis]KAG7474601.1 hypothetical protein JOB18_013217 [Solea senegalensis]